MTEQQAHDEREQRAPRRQREPVDTVMLCLYGVGAAMVGFLVWWSLSVMV